MTENYKTNFCARALKQARELAAQLISIEGKLIREPVKLKNTFTLEGLSDGVIRDRQELILSRWMQDLQFFNSFRRFGLPLCHKRAEKIVRESLDLSAQEVLRDAHVKRAVVSACLMILRQSVGSCFATAPAIMIQEEHTDLFLQDLYDLLTQGQLKRVIRGKSYCVPLGLGFAAPGEHALLKAWEFTLASLSEAGRDFPRWNLSLSLGLDPKEKGGIGEAVYSLLEEKLEDSNRKLRDAHMLAQEALDQCRLAESLFKQSSSEQDRRRLHAEYTARYHHFQSVCDMRDEYQSFGKTVSLLFSTLIKKYSEKIPEYFQEIYDPAMASYSEDYYEDSPAGFRLIYKHGRSDPSLWTAINSSDQFIQTLVDFFTLTEGQFIHDFESEAEKKLIVEVTSCLILHIRSEEFLHQALSRAARESRTPWSYTSGGTMDLLLMIYFCRENPIIQESKWVETPLELLIFLIDVIKNLPHKTTDVFINNPAKRVLMHSPNHAFSLQPGRPWFRRAWQDPVFTYTWVRDEFLIPRQNFYERLLLSPKEQEVLMGKMGVKINVHGTVKVAEFYQILLEKNVSDAAPLLYRFLPLIPRNECQAALQNILQPWLKEIRLPESLPEYLTSEELCNLAKLNLACKEPFQGDIHLMVIQRARALDLAPTPFLFADTNWAENYFAFVLNPGTQQLELWRCDYTGSTGYPMTSWQPWLDGTQKLPWVVYTNV